MVEREIDRQTETERDRIKKRIIREIEIENVTIKI